MVVSSWQTPWQIKDIVYLACVGPILLAALLEWFLWLAAFLYCFCKACQKADHWSQRVLAVTLMIVVLLFRAVFLPITIVTLPLPSKATHYFPHRAVHVLQEFAFWSFAVLLVVPWLICILRLLVVPLGRKKLVPWELTEHNAPKVVVVMPVYKEPADSLWRGLNSVVESDYPAACIHVFVSFDGEDIDELYLNTVDRLGIPITLKDLPKSITVPFKGARVTVSRFPHGGKRHCQKATYRLIDRLYRAYVRGHDDLFILFIDSDCILDRVCIQNFMWDMQLKPQSKHNMLAMTGIITACTHRHSLITLLQDMEYIHGQLYERSVESGCGAVTCLPGALTILRYSAFRNMAKFYFADTAEHCADLFDYGKTHLGEDRWLTHLFMLGAKKRYQIQMSTSAFCKTEAVQSFGSLLKQRRRWFLGFITNEVCMLTDWRLWHKYPLLCLLRLMQTTVRTTALLFLIMLLSVVTTSNTVDRLPWKFIMASLGANWLMMLAFAVRLHRYKAALYPLMFVLNPFMNWIYIVYGIFTAGQRTWGGPRADAGAADAHTSPQAVIEQAIACGDDLNLRPETFRPALEKTRGRRRLRNTTLQPSSSVEGRFAAAAAAAAHGHEDDHHDHGLQHDLHLDYDHHHHHSHADSADLSDSDISIHSPRQVVPVNARVSAAAAASTSTMPGSSSSSSSSSSTKTLSVHDGRNLDGLSLPEPVADPLQRWPRLSLAAGSTVAHPSPLGRQSPLQPDDSQMDGDDHQSSEPGPEPEPEPEPEPDSRVPTETSRLMVTGHQDDGGKLANMV